MSKTRQSGALMLVELLLALMFFSICAAICLQLFVSARQSGEHSAALSSAAIQSQNAAEAWKASGGDIYGTAELMGGSTKVEGSGSEAETAIYFDSAWGPSNFAEYDYCMTLSASGNKLDITVTDSDGGEIFAITATASQQGVAR